MDPTHHFASIEPQTVASLVEQYPSVVPSKLTDLDTSRYERLPATIASRKLANDIYLTQAELATLVDWKLSHGTFRPSLKALVNQNSEEAVETETRNAFEQLDATPPTIESAKEGLKLLTKLKGIGPATASLALSVFDPNSVPFFSDELFRWVFWEDGKGKGWDRQIKYTQKEYLELLERVQRRVLDNGLKAVDLERAAYVLGKSDDDDKNKDQEVARGKSKRKAEDEDTTQLPAKKSKASSGEKQAKPAKEQKTGSRSSARLMKTKQAYKE